MKKKHYILDVISFTIIIFNVVSVFCFFLPPGRAYYMPEWLMEFTGVLTEYAYFGGMGISGIIGIILNVVSIIYKLRTKESIKNNIVYLLLFVLTIPWAWLLFQAAMSV